MKSKSNPQYRRVKVPKSSHKFGCSLQGAGRHMKENAISMPVAGTVFYIVMSACGVAPPLLPAVHCMPQSHPHACLPCVYAAEAVPFACPAPTTSSSADPVLCNRKHYSASACRADVTAVQSAARRRAGLRCGRSLSAARYSCLRQPPHLLSLSLHHQLPAHLPVL